MDRTAWIAIALATIGLVASIYWQQRQMAEARAKYLQEQAALAAQATPTTQTAQARTPAASSTATTQSPVEEQPRPAAPEKEETLKSDVAQLRFSNNRGGLGTVELLNHRAEQGQLVQLNAGRTPAIGAITLGLMDDFAALTRGRSPKIRIAGKITGMNSPPILLQEQRRLGERLHAILRSVKSTRSQNKRASKTITRSAWRLPSKTTVLLHSKHPAFS